MYTYVKLDQNRQVVGWQQSEEPLDFADLMEITEENPDELMGKIYDDAGGWIAAPVAIPPIDKVRFLDLLGPAAIKFKAAIRNPETPVDIAAALDVAQEYLNAATALDLSSPRMQGFLAQLQQAGILTAADVVRISANQTAEEAAAAP